MNINWDQLEELCNKYGESFYLLDSKKFEQNYDEFLGMFRDIYPKTFIAYSYKTNYTPKLCSIVDRKSGYAEVVSEMEYDLAIKLGVSPKNIIVNGPYKNKQTLEKFLLDGSIVNLDSFNEVTIVEKIAKNNRDIELPIGIRCNFEVNDSLISRFGFDVNSEDFYHTFNRLRTINNIDIKGLHCHFPNRDIESYIVRVDRILHLVSQLFPSPPEFVDVGGGYFGKVSQSLEKQFNYKVPSYQEYANVIASKFKDFFKDLDESKKPKLLLEPGSALVADTMKFVAKVIDIKRIRNKSIAMTTGSKFNISLLSSSINLPVSVYASSNKNHKQEYFDFIDISGYTCIENDYLYKGYKGPLATGDYVVFDNAGSYSIVFKPPFILPNVAVIDYDNQTGEHEVVKRKETMEDVFSTFIFDS